MSMLLTGSHVATANEVAALDKFMMFTLKVYNSGVRNKMLPDLVKLWEREAHRYGHDVDNFTQANRARLANM